MEAGGEEPPEKCWEEEQVQGSRQIISSERAYILIYMYL